MIDTTTGMQIKYFSGQHRHAGTSRDGILQPVTPNFKTATPRDPWCFTRHSADRKNLQGCQSLVQLWNLQKPQEAAAQSVLSPKTYYRGLQKLPTLFKWGLLIITIA